MAQEMGQGEGTLTKAAGLVATAKQDFDSLSASLSGKISGIQGKWAGAGGSAFFALHTAWSEKQRVITKALNDFEASLTSTEKDNINTDQTQSSNFNKLTGRLG